MHYEQLAGKVTGLGTASSRQDFVFQQGDHAVGATAATGLALQGLSGAAASTSASSGDATDAITNFQCRVGPHQVSGYLGSVGFSDGDDVIVLGQRHGDSWVAHAVARPQDRTIWMPPHSGRGHLAFLKALLLGWGPACLLGPVLFSTMMDMANDIPADWHWRLTSSLIGSAILILVVGLVAWRVYPYAVLSTALFTALDLPDAKRISLPRITKQYLRKTPDAVQQFHPFTPWVFRY